MDVRIVEAPVPDSLDSPEAWALRGAVAAERAAEFAIFGYPDLSDTLRESWVWARNTDYARRVRLVAVVADAPGEPGSASGAVVGSAFLTFPNEDNDHLVEAVVRVHPAWTGRGVGTALAEALEVRARAEDRRLVVAWTDHPAEPPEPTDAAGESAVIRPPTGSGRLPRDSSARFAVAHGYALEQAERHSILDLPADGGLLARLADGARSGAGPDYGLVTWSDEAPEHWLDAYAVLQTRMSTDVPMAGLEIEEDVWDAERIRDFERTQLACGRHTLVAAAEHRPTGTLAAYTVLVVRPGEEPGEAPAVFQDATLVLREHRGHRLGMLVKVANVRALTQAFGAARRIHTWNAEENAHMLAINVAMGFRPAGISGTWQKHLA